MPAINKWFAGMARSYKVYRALMKYPGVIKPESELE